MSPFSRSLMTLKASTIMAKGFYDPERKSQNQRHRHRNLWHVLLGSAFWYS